MFDNADQDEAEAFGEMLTAAGKTLTIGMTAFAMAMTIAAPFREHAAPPGVQAQTAIDADPS